VSIFKYSILSEHYKILGDHGDNHPASPICGHPFSCHQVPGDIAATMARNTTAYYTPEEAQVLYQ
jgi:hypothetical protein